MAIYYYQERLCTDTGHYFFNTIQDKTFHIEHHRFVQAFAELPVLIGIYFGISLKTIAICFSCMHVFFFFIIGLALFFYFKNIYAWLLILFLQIIGFQIGFINPIIEHYYGIALGVALYTILLHRVTVSISLFCLLQVVAVLLLTSHPFAILLYIFIIILDYLHKKNIRFSFSLCIILPLYFLFKSQFASTYEIDKTAWMFNTSINKTYLQLFTTSLWISFAKLLWIHYWHWLLLLCINSYFLYRSKQFILLFIMLFFVIATIGLVQFAYAITTYAGQAEQALFAIVPYVLFPFFMLVLPNIKWAKSIFLLLAIIAIICIYNQFAFMQTYTAKTQQIKSWIGKARAANGDKFTILPTRYLHIDGLINWDVPMQSLFLSAMDGGKQVMIVPLVDDNERLIKTLLPNQYLYRNNEVFDIDKLNKNYFLVSNNGYHELPE